MKLYYHDNKHGDARLPHDSGIDLPLAFLDRLGIIIYHLPISVPASAERLEQIAKARNYPNRDEITVSPAALGSSYEEKINAFYDEHIHEDEELRYILKGTGYWDVRDAEDKWLRLTAGPGDLLILPAGIYHRFTVDESNYCKAIRLFQTNPKWAALNRSEETEANEFRKEYVLERNRRCGSFIKDVMS